MDPLSLIAGGGVLLVGYLLGRVNRRWTPKDPPGVEQTKCPGCRHGLSYRDPATGHCTALVEQPDRYNGNGTAIGYIWVNCTCQSHTTADQLMLETATWRREGTDPR